MLKLFDRYILREILPPFGIGIVLFTFVLLMNQILVLAELFIAKGVPFGTAVEVLALLIPSLLAFAVPMAVLMGILAGLSRLSSDLEITAFRTLGVGFARFLKPLLLFAAAGWAVTSALTLWVGPRANHRWVKTVTTSVLARVQLKFVPREFNESVPGMIVFVRDIAADESWRDVFVAITTDPETPRVILARRGRLNLYPEAKRATLELEDGEVHSYPRAEPEKYRLTTFRKDVEEVDVSGLFSSLSSAKRVREKDIGELRAGAAALRAERARLRADLARPEKTEAERTSLRRSLSSADRDARAHGVEIHKKFALPFACFIFVLIGLPLGATTRKGGRTSGFTLSIGIIIAYYILITAGEKFAMDGRLAPAPAMWGPDILLALAGLALLVGTRREWRFRPALFRRRRLPAAGGAAAARPLRIRARLRFPHILDRYIMRKWLGLFAIVVLALLSLSLIVTFFERIDNVYTHNQPLSLFFRYLWFRVPEFTSYILPVAALTTALIALGLLAKFNETTAMKACGISLYRAVLPVLFLGFATSLAAFALQERILPRANRKAEETWDRINEIPPRSYSFANRHWVLGREQDRIFHYDFFDPVAGRFSRFATYDIDGQSWNLRGRSSADEALFDGADLVLSKGWERTFPSAGAPGRFETRRSWRLERGEPRTTFVKDVEEPGQMTYSELRRYTDDASRAGFETTRLKVDLATKLSFPLAGLIMTLIAVPFAFAMGRRGTLVGIGLSLAIAMVYWGAIGVFRSLGYVGFLGPFLAAWGPDLLFGLAGTGFLLRMRT
jgi:LPS export ABC transporter permease LptG/LPS export ABC transporter permease LptF